MHGTSSWTNLPTRGKIPEAGGTTILSPWNGGHKHKLDKTRQQRNMFQIKEQAKPPEELREVEIGNLPEKKKLKVMTVRMI